MKDDYIMFGHTLSNQKIKSEILCFYIARGERNGEKNNLLFMDVIHQNIGQPNERMGERESTEKLSGCYSI